jgi:3',5'-cyclic AMP phosphodiesterase CpdA
MTSGNLLIAQISDFHVSGGPGGHARNADAAAFLARAVEHVNGLDPRPDLVLATGDLCDPGVEEDYVVLRALLARLELPAFLIPGNHDDRALLRKAFPDHDYLPGSGPFLHYVLDDYPLRLIGLDTVLPGDDGGLMCAERLAWFADRLAEAPQRPTFVFMHHPPVTTGLPFIDAINCDGGAAFGRIVAANRQIEAVVCGHVHRPIVLAWNGTMVVTAPSTCYQFPLEMREGVKIAPLAEPPACRLYLWRPQAGLVTHLSYIRGNTAEASRLG